LALDVAAMCEPFAAAVHAVVEQSRPRFGDIVLLSGPGPIGLMCLKLLVAQGLKVIVAGTAADAARLAKAAELGALQVADGERQNLAEIVAHETDGCGADVAIECAGAAQSVTNCLGALRPGGRMTQVGHFGQPVTINYDAVAFRELQIRGSVGYTAATWDRVMRILAEGQINLADMISHRLELDQWQDAFALCERKEGLKVLLHSDESKVA
jgi:L-iditol 2-dehydrogenase